MGCGCTHGKMPNMDYLDIIKDGDELLQTIYESNIALDNLITHCRFFGKLYNCSDIFFPVLTEEGICFSFNLLDRSQLFHKATSVPNFRSFQSFNMPVQVPVS